MTEEVDAAGEDDELVALAVVNEFRGRRLTSVGVPRKTSLAWSSGVPRFQSLTTKG